MGFVRLTPGGGDVVDVVDAYRLADGTGVHLRANMVASADGAAVVDGRVGPLTSPADQDLLYALRALADVVLVGASTVRAEGYAAPLVGADLVDGRRRDGRTEQPRLAVVSGRLDLDFAAPVFGANPEPVLLLTCASAPPDRRRAAERVADVRVVGDERVDLTAAVRMLTAGGTPHVLTEGGPHLLGQLVAAQLVDELCFTFAPTLVGGAGMRVVVGPADEPVTLTPTQVLTADGSLFVRYAVNRRSGTSRTDGTDAASR